MRRYLFLFLIIFFVVLEGYPQKIDYSPLTCIKRTDTVSYPFCETLDAPRVHPWPLERKYWRELPTFTYKDIGEIEKMDHPKSKAFFIRRLNPTNGDYYLVSCRFGVGDSQKVLLITYDTLGNVIDHLEAEIYFPGFIHLKQWCITSDMEVVVYHLKLDTPRPYRSWGEEYDSFPGQRTDSYYRIDSTGKFHFIDEIRYRPKDYTKTYLEDRKNSNIFDGNEERLEE